MYKLNVNVVSVEKKRQYTKEKAGI